ncbi:SIR2 family protein [Castellaniella ginsengisoli]|uniref:SIR2 family protein n=1 Tax=Castellaniella ginsengisoli TaxID=546114 RepID=A0AB39DQD0_9BURK
MKIASLEDRLSDYGSGGYYLLETFVLELLRLEADANNQELHIESRRSHAPLDAFAPKGIGDIRIPLSVEVVSVLSSNRLRKIIELHRAFKKSESEGLLIIALRQMTKESNYVKKIIENAGINVYIWDQARLQVLIDRHREAAENISENLFSIRLKIAVSNSPGDWKEKRDSIIFNVIEKFRNGRLSLFLGAGVSSSAGLPNWDTLLNRLFVSMLTESDQDVDGSENEGINSIVRRLRQIDGPSTLTLARYIRKGMSAGLSAERDKFIDSVTKQLYGLRDRRFSLNSELIKEIVNICTPMRSGAKVRGVVTYNFDDLLERVLEEREIAHRSIFEEEDLADPEELPLYHVHGFLPEERSEYPNLDRSTLVFSEEGYHQIYRDAYHWSNLIQLNWLKETSCLMIGLSLTDPNLRRLLEISTKSVDKPRHFAFMKRTGYDEFAKRGESTLVKAPAQMVRKFLDRHHNLNEEVLRELGVSIIWYEHYHEIPELLKRIRKSI